jgi:hypothetical protein
MQVNYIVRQHPDMGDAHLAPAGLSARVVNLFALDGAWRAARQL